MLGDFLRKNVYAAAIITILRVYLGWKWMTGGWGKVTGDFSAAGYLKGAIGKASGENPTVQGWWANFLNKDKTFR